jgi:peroxisomal enoyl-CoA hydratase 2
MATFDALAALPHGSPGPWGTRTEIPFERRDVLLYAAGIAIDDLRFAFEGHPEFAVFPTFPIRWGGRGLAVDPRAIPASPGHFSIDAERYIEALRPMPVAGSAFANSRLIAVNPRGKGNAFVEVETVVADSEGAPYARMISGSFRRGVERLGDIAAFSGVGQTHSSVAGNPDGPPDVELSIEIASNQAQVYRLSGDYNPLHVDPAAARAGGFARPILHGLCTLGICAQLLVRRLCSGEPGRFRKLKVRFSAPVYPGDRLRVLAWREHANRAIFEARVADTIVVSNACFEFD